MRRFLSAALALLFSATLAFGAFGQALPQKVCTLQSPMVALGYCQQTSVSTAVGLNSGSGACASGIPAGAVLAVVEVESQTARWRDDGTAPTASVGMPLAAGAPYTFTSQVTDDNALADVKLIPETGSMTVDATFYGIR
jgi:hypothetical protein